MSILCQCPNTYERRYVSYSYRVTRTAKYAQESEVEKSVGR